MKTYYAIPDNADVKHILNPERSFLSIVLPRAGVNLVYDPEALAFGRGVQSGYVALGGATVAPATDKRRRGLYGVHVTDVDVVDDGVAYEVVSTTVAATTYSFSFDHWGVGRFKVYILDRADSNKVVALGWFEGQPFWTRPSLTMYTPAAAEPTLCVAAAEVNLGSFYVDGYQFEQGEATTFISGDLHEEYTGRAQYGWLGGPHNSASYRLPSARSGGLAIPLNEIGFDLSQIKDWGLPKPEHLFSTYALRNGAFYHHSRLGEREFSFIGELGEAGFREYLGSRGALSYPMDYTASRPFRMIFQGYDALVPTTERVVFDAVYSQGLEGENNNLLGESVAVTVTLPDPYFYADGDDAAILGLYNTVTAAGPGVVGRDANGDWRALIGTSVFPSATFVARGLCVGEDFNLYAVGDDDDGFGYLLRWDGADWSQLGPRWLGPLYCVAWGPGNTVLFAGATLQAEGAPGLDPGFPVWQYDLLADTYAPLGGVYFTNSLANPSGVWSIVVHPSGYVVAGGAFDEYTPDGISATPVLNVASYTIADDVWAAMGDGLIPNTGIPLDPPVGYVTSLAIGPDYSVWAGGTFDSVDFTEGALIARWHYTTNEWYMYGDWPMEFPPASNVRVLGQIHALAFTRDGKLILGGRFDTSRYREDETYDGVKPLMNLAKLTPSSILADDHFGRLESLQYGTNEEIGGTRVAVYALTVDRENVLYVGGIFNAIRRFLPLPGSGNFTLVEIAVDGLAAFNLNGGTWLRPETQLDPVDPFGGGLPGVIALTTGGNGNQNFGSGVLGEISVGNPTLTDLGLAVPPGADNTVFAGAFLEVGAKIPKVDLVDTGCAVDTRPRMRFVGPGILYSIENYTNGTAVEFDRVALQANQALTVDLARARPTIVTSGGLNSGLLKRGSGLSAFRLERGENRIKVIFRNLDDTHTVSAREATLWWRPKYLTLDALGGCD